MTEREFGFFLADLIWLGGVVKDIEIEIRGLRDEGLFTENQGLVVELQDGSRFMLPILQMGLK